MSSGQSNFKIFTFISQFAINMLVPIFMCSFAGYYIDKFFSTQIWFVVLFFVGAIAGGRNIYLLAKKTYSDSGDSNDEQEDKKDR